MIIRDLSIKSNLVNRIYFMQTDANNYIEHCKQDLVRAVRMSLPHKNWFYFYYLSSVKNHNIPERHMVEFGQYFIIKVKDFDYDRSTMRYERW